MQDQTPTGTTVLDVNAIDFTGGWAANNATDSLLPLDPNPFTLRSVGAARLNAYLTDGGGSDSFTYDGSRVVMVYAVEGVSESDPASVIPGARKFTAKTGRVALFKAAVAGGSFRIANPMHWGAVDNTATSLAAPIAVWDLYPPTDINLGPTGSSNPLLPGPASSVNVAQVGTLLGAGNADARFLAVESSAGFPSSLSKDDFWNSPNLAGLNILEHLVLGLNEGLDVNPDLQYINGGVGTNGFDALNVIAQQLGGLTNFATGFGPGPASGFNPFTLTNQATPDNVFNITGGALGFASQVVPEPGSMAIFALILGGAGAVVGWRRRRTRSATKA
jgi:hypothetical protein